MKRKDIVTDHGKPVTLVGPELEVGAKAPDFRVLDANLKELKLKDFTGKVKVISVTPSLDTPVCNLQAKRFNEEATNLPGEVVVLNMSMDLPFAISRFCADEGIDKVRVLSDHREASFGISYGVLIKELRLLARSIFIIDKNDRIAYIQIVPEITQHPDYDKALEALKIIN
ncbi:hypothetical protein LCGC14_2830210 [marine sediment metagenome]|uniref:Thioredoxin domain-containing protein n=1 Tax=marine sediment metagenome TaxID=412755 RepID=A0A0F8YEA1_9ZZZZ